MSGFPGVAKATSIDSEDTFNVRADTAWHRFKIPKRYLVLLMVYSGIFIAAWMSVNLGTLVYRVMVKGETHTYSHMLNFTTQEKDLMFVIETCGMIIGMIPGALAVIRFSAFKMIATSVLLSSILHVAIPLTLHHSVTSIVLIDFLRGLVLGPLLPACIDIWRLWAPTRERTTLVAITFSGWYCGKSICYLISMSLNDVLGEAAGFFTSGFIGILWSLLWCVVVHESPSSHPTITQSELQYLEQSVSQESKIKVSVSSIPVKSIITSLPAIAPILGLSVSLWTCNLLYFMIIMDIIENDNAYMVLENLPILLFWVSSIVSGIISDLVISRNCVNTTLVRKIANSGGLAVCGVAVICTITQMRVFKITSVMLAAVFIGFSSSGLTANTLEVSAKYACLLVGVGEVLVFAALIAFTVLFKEIISNEHSIFIWHVVSGVSGGLCLATAALYALGGSGHEQPWSGSRQHDARGSERYPDSVVHEDMELTLEERL